MKKARKLTAVLLSLVMLLALEPTRFSPALCPAMLQQMEKPEAPCWVTSPGAAA